jgi:hypothetical protein
LEQTCDLHKKNIIRLGIAAVDEGQQQSHERSASGAIDPDQSQLRQETAFDREFPSCFDARIGGDGCPGRIF